MLKKYWKHILAVLGLGIAVAFAAAPDPTTPPPIPQMQIDGQNVTFTFTDDNTNEDLLIYTDQGTYSSLTDIKPKIAIVNTSGVDQNVSVQPYFANSKRKLGSLSVITDTHINYATTTAPDISCSKMDSCSVTGSHQVVTWTNQRADKVLGLPKTPPAKAKASQKLLDKSGTVFIPAGGTVFLEMDVNLNPDKESSLTPEKFYIEAIGDQGGYGHLDPTISFVTNTRALATGGTGATITTPAGVDTSSATLLVAVVTDYLSGPATTVSDSNGNTWHALTRQATGSGFRNQIFYAWDHGGTALVVGANHTFSAASGDYNVLDVMAFSGTQTSSDPFDVQNGTLGSSVTSVSPGSITPSADGEVIIAGIGYDTTQTLSINSSFNITNQDPFSNGVHFGGAGAYFIQTTATAINPAWSAASAFSAVVTIASFKAGTGGGGGGSSSTPAYLDFY